MLKSRSTYIYLVFLFAFSACGHVGPSTIERDRLDYSSTIAESWKKVMLLNIIKLRYGDTPVFLEVGSIVNQYSMETELNASVGMTSGDVFENGFSLGGKGKYADRPTITYSPLTGKKFSRSLLKPIPPQALLNLVQSGWDAEFILGTCLSAINDLFNGSGRLVKVQHADKGFEELLENLAYIQQAGGLGARMVEQGSVQSIVFFRRNLGEELEKRVSSVVKLLKLNPEKRSFDLVYGSSTADDSEIAMLTRSMLDIIIELAQFVRIPEKHIQENRASPGYFSKAVSVDDFDSRVLIRSSKEKPHDAFIAIEYRDFWFYINDTDFQSKRIFSFLLFLLSIAESGSQVLAPVLTLPAG